jgi:hypothetical protein
LSCRPNSSRSLRIPAAITPQDQICTQSSWGLHETLAEYVRLPDFGKFVVGDRFVTSFSGYAAERGRRLGHRLEFPKIDTTVQRFLDWMLELIFQQTRADLERAESA